MSEFKHPNSIGPTTALRKQEGGGNNIITSQPDHFINDSYFIVIVNIGSNKLRIYAGGFCVIFGTYNKFVHCFLGGIGVIQFHDSLLKTQGSFTVGGLMSWSKPPPIPRVPVTFEA